MSLSRGSLQCFRNGCEVIAFYAWGPSRFRVSLSFEFFGFVGVQELLDFGSLQFRYLSSAPSDCPLGSPFCSLGHISLEDWRATAINPCATCICGYEQCNGISTLPLYACNVQLHQVAAVQYNFCTNISKQKQLGLTLFIAISGVQLTKWCTQTGTKKAMQLYEGFIGVWCFLGFSIVMN